MHSTQLEIKGRKDPNFAVGYRKPDQSANIKPVSYHNVSYKHAGGGMISTPTDLVRFAQATHFGNLLEDKTRSVMYRTKYAHLDGSGETALTWRVGKRNGRDAIHMGGSISGFRSYLTTWPDERLTIAVMANQDDFEYRSEIAFDIAQMYFDSGL